MKDFPVVFMGTPEFAVAILDKLRSEFSVSAVITAPDKPAGRGQQLRESAVKQYAVKHGLRVLQPTNLKDPDFIETLRAIQAELFVVVAFRMLPEAVWAMPPRGTINLHASLLPDYRGAAPINRAIMNGESESGVTTFFIEKEIDTGKVIERRQIAIGPDETAGELHDRLMELGAETTLSTVRQIAQGNATGIPQRELLHGTPKEAPKLFKPDCEIDFRNRAQDVHNFIRGLSPYPAAWCTLKDQTNGTSKTFKLFGSQVSDKKVTEVGKPVRGNDGLLFPCSDFYVVITEIQPEGKRRMNWREYLAGNRIEDWEYPSV